jgi:hypothetical protein
MPFAGRRPLPSKRMMQPVPISALVFPLLFCGFDLKRELCGGTQPSPECHPGDAGDRGSHLERVPLRKFLDHTLLPPIECFHEEKVSNTVCASTLLAPERGGNVTLLL